jgi:hypothetical protein
MDPLTLLAIGLGAGLLKSEAIDRPAANRQRKLAAETQKYSPWTGLKAEEVKEPNAMGDMLTFGATGAQLGAGLQNAEASKGLMKAQQNWLSRGGSPMYTAATYAGPTPRANPWRLGDYNF